MKRKNLYPFLVSFVLLITVIIINRKSFKEMVEYTRWVDHTHQVITSLGQLSNHFKSAQIYSPTLYKNNTQFYDLYKKEAESVTDDLAHLELLTRDNADQKARIDELSIMIQAQMPMLMEKNIAEIIQSGEAHRLKNLFQINETINSAVVHEQELMITRKNQLKFSTERANVLTIIFSAIALLLLIVTFASNILLFRRRNWLEGFLESVLNTSQNGIVTYKAVRKKGKIVDFTVEFANAAIAGLLGIKPNEVMGKRLSQMQSYVRDTGMFETYANVVETGEQFSAETLYKGNGVERWVYVLLARLDDGLTATFHDISSIKKYEADLKSNIKQLEVSNAELEQYAYVASHDLQEPLRKIMVYSNMLNKMYGDKLDEKGRLHITKIIASSQRMQNLIKDILNFSEIKREASFTQVNLNEILKNVLEDLDLFITQQNATVIVDNLPVIEGISLQMNQLFYNLVNNAVKFSGGKPAFKIHISCRVLIPQEVIKFQDLDPSLSYYEIVCADNGIGFEQEFSEQIFGVFKRLNDKKNFPGSGIGLALCRKVVANHRGQIYATGKVDEGASFYILLPAKQPA